MNPMKISILAFLLLSLTGCISSHTIEMERKKTLCVQFGMSYQEFQFKDMVDYDVICRNEESGELIYMTLIPENKVREGLY